MAKIPIYGEFESKTTSGVLADAKTIRGGYMVLTTAQRTSLPDDMKTIGMLVYDSDLGYELRLTENGWSITKTIIKATDIYVNQNAWVDDTTYTAYPYKTKLAITSVSQLMIAEVNFSLEQSLSGNYAPVCETTSGGVFIYAKEKATITVPSVVVVG